MEVGKIDEKELKKHAVRQRVRRLERNSPGVRPLHPAAKEIINEVYRGIGGGRRIGSRPVRKP